MIEWSWEWHKGRPGLMARLLVEEGHYFAHAPCPPEMMDDLPMMQHVIGEMLAPQCLSLIEEVVQETEGQRPQAARINGG